MREFSDIINEHFVLFLMATTAVIICMLYNECVLPRSLFDDSIKHC